MPPLAVDLRSLQAGDCILYKSTGFSGRIIALKTWHDIGHVEIYDGSSYSWASRDGIGVGHYPWRDTDIAYVLRPNTVKLDLVKGRQYGNSMLGAPYAWLDLLAFVGIKRDHKGIVCSPFACAFYRACGWNLFPTDDINFIAPFEFLNLAGNGFDILYPPPVV